MSEHHADPLPQLHVDPDLFPRDDVPVLRRFLRAAAILVSALRRRRA